MRLFWLFVVGTVGFALISYFEQVPVLGWFGAVVSVVAWVTLGRAVAQEGVSATITSAILGAWTGFVGAFTAWAFQTGNLFGLTTPGFERVGAGFGFVGATLGLVYWPLIRAAICFAAALLSRETLGLARGHITRSGWHGGASCSRAAGAPGTRSRDREAVADDRGGCGDGATAEPGQDPRRSASRSGAPTPGTGPASSARAEAMRRGGVCEKRSRRERIRRDAPVQRRRPAHC